jgi:murein DD-endopeptidase MepM/ murein hydrolase activator NlpD
VTAIADRFDLPFPASTFGNRFGIHDVVNGKDLYGPQGHRGTDFKVGAGTPVPVIANGVIDEVLHSVALGNVIVVKHYLDEARAVFSGYCHLEQTLVRAGQTVTRGNLIAKSGNTGTATTGPHLHLTMSHEEMGVEWGDVFDPIEFITTHKPAATPTVFTPRTTKAQRGEGLIVIANRSHISFSRIKQLNPNITGPNFIVRLGQEVRIG